MTDKILHQLDDRSDTLNWYTGLYLSLPRIFMSVVRRKIVVTPIVQAVLIPLYKIEDPITKRELSIHITDRYFFVGTSEEILSEADIGIQGQGGNITLMRENHVDRPAKIKAKDIRNVIYTHVNKRRSVIQEHVAVSITGGTFKDWEGVVIEKQKGNPDNVTVNFTSDEYEYSAEVPVALCKLAY